MQSGACERDHVDVLSVGELLHGTCVKMMVLVRLAGWVRYFKMGGMVRAITHLPTQGNRHTHHQGRQNI